MSLPIPEASLVRLRASYAQFEQLATVVVEAMGIDPSRVQRVDLPAGALIMLEDQVGVERANGVVAEVSS